MIDAEKLHEAQDFIAKEVQKHCATRIDALTWEQTPQDRNTEIHRVVISRGGEKSIFTFTEYDLLEDYGSKKWERQMRDHIMDILVEL